MVELLGPNRFKLGLFCYNVEGGVALTTVPERWRAGSRGSHASLRRSAPVALEAVKDTRSGKLSCMVRRAADMGKVSP